MSLRRFGVGLDGAFYQVVVNLRPAVRQIDFETRALVGRVVERLLEGALRQKPVVGLSLRYNRLSTPVARRPNWCIHSFVVSAAD